VTEFKYLTGQTHRKTSIVYEFPQADGDPYYPIPRPENAELYAKYKALADARDDVNFVGRLATYKYYNMDQIVAQAMTVYGKIAGLKRKEASVVTLPARNTSKSLVYPMSLGSNKVNSNGNGTRITNVDAVS
jgi:UDP-galactopyranose mutase